MMTGSQYKVPFFKTEQTQLCGLDSHKSSRHFLSSQEAITDQFSSDHLIQPYQVSYSCTMYVTDFLAKGFKSERRTEYLSEPSSPSGVRQKQKQHRHLPVWGRLNKASYFYGQWDYQKNIINIDLRLFKNEIVNIFANWASIDMPVSGDIKW